VPQAGASWGPPPTLLGHVGPKAHIAIVTLVVALLAGTVGAYAYDASRSDQIAEGVRVGGVPVGGLERDEARGLLEVKVAQPVERPVIVKFGDAQYRLGPDELEAHADVEAMVDRAIEVSRSASLPERLWRYVSGGEVDERVQPQVAYSKRALNEFVAEVAGEIDRDPVDARVEPGPASLGTVKEENGRAVRTDALRERLQRAVRSREGRLVKAPVRRLEPEVTLDQLAERHPTYLTVDRGSFTLRLWKDLELEKTYTIAVGQAGYDTPAGLYEIQNKAVDPAWHVPNSAWAGALAGRVIPPGPENPIKSRWLGIYDGAGIHGTDSLGSLGSAASRGCIRMSIPEVEELYERVGVGTPIYIG
jgi:lipoprotein-anchoring transpeptidase ErfK/SrfK